MIVVLLASLLAIDEPRFTQTHTPDALVRAEAYRRDTGAVMGQALRLLGSKPYSSRVSDTPQGSIAVLMVPASSGSPSRAVVYATATERDDFICVLAMQQEDGWNNTDDAMRWCNSFLFQPIIVVPMQPLTSRRPVPPEG